MNAPILVAGELVSLVVVVRAVLRQLASFVGGAR